MASKKKLKKLRKVRYYHTSKFTRFQPGDIISPQRLRAFSGIIYGFDKGGVYLTTSPRAHWTLYWRGENRIGQRRYMIYEVKPLAKVVICDIDEEAIALGPVEVVRRIGPPDVKSEAEYIKARQNDTWYLLGTSVPNWVRAGRVQVLEEDGYYKEVYSPNSYYREREKILEQKRREREKRILERELRRKRRKPRKKVKEKAKKKAKKKGKVPTNREEE